RRITHAFSIFITHGQSSISPTSNGTTSLILSTTESTHHVRDVRVAGFIQHLGCTLRQPTSLAANNNRRIFGNVGFNNFDKIGVWCWLSWLLKEKGRNVDSTLWMSSREFWHGPHVEIDDLRILLHQIVGLLGSNLLYRHWFLLPQIRST